MGIQAIAALGFYITFSAGQMSMCHAVFMGIGGYASGLISTNTSLPFAIALLSGAILAAVFGMIVCYPTLHLRHFYLAVATFAWGQILIILAVVTPQIGGALGISGVPLKTSIFNVYLFLAFLVFCFQGLSGSSFLRSCKAIRKDNELSSVSGINVAKYRLITFIVGAFICGIAGGFEVHYLSAVQPHFYGMFKSVDILFYCIIGGMEIYVGAIFGAFLLTLLPEILHAVAEWRMPIYGILLVGILVFRPQGLIDSRLWDSLIIFLRRSIFLAFKPRKKIDENKIC